MIILLSERFWPRYTREPLPGRRAPPPDLCGTWKVLVWSPNQRWYLVSVTLGLPQSKDPVSERSPLVIYRVVDAWNYVAPDADRPPVAARALAEYIVRLFPP